ncbi:MAG: hypothetical protein U0234_14545 [Sandaracinus sp.]
MTLPPENGARFELSRLETSAEGARYEVRVHEASARWSAGTTVGAAALEIQWAATPPAWIASTTLLFFKTLQKNHGKDGSWPARLVRWRAERE